MVTMASKSQEKDMGGRLRALVDNCFEEGHYESGIATLDTLRSEFYKPSILHILQLIVMALYPPSPPAPQPSKRTFGTPRKLQDRQKTPLLPGPKATHAALALLDAFVITNHPVPLTAGLPRYEDGDEDATFQQGSLDELEYSETYTSKEALRIASEKDFWSCLRRNFIKRPDVRGQNEDDWEADVPGTIGQWSWPVLEWFLKLLAKEESINEASGEGRHSKILLHQIPGPRTGKGPRWDASTVVDVILACLNSSSTPQTAHVYRRKAMGTSLLDMTLNLVAAQLLSEPHLARELCGRLDSFSPAETSQFLGCIPPRHAKFKVTLCSQYLLRLSQNPVSVNVPEKKPKPRARPMPSRKAQETRESSLADLSHTSDSKPSVMPSTTKVLELVLLPQADTENAHDKSLCTKFHMLSTYSRLREEVEPEEWRFYIQSGFVREVVQRTFAAPQGQDATALATSLSTAGLGLLTMWEDRHLTNGLPSQAS